GRKRLGAALLARGCALGSGLLTLAATSPVDGSPPRLFEGVLAAVAGSPRAAVAALAKAVAMQAALKISMLAVLASLGVGAACLGAWSLLSAAAPPPDSRAMPAKADRPQPSAEGRAAQPLMNLSGRVLDPQGQPLSGAKLLLVGKTAKPVDLGTSAPDGRFTVTVPKDSTHDHHFLAASAPGTGMDFVSTGGLDPARTLELRLVRDNVIRGRVVDTQGKPVAGVQVGVAAIGVSDANSADRFLAAWTNRMFWIWPGEDRTVWQEGGVIAESTTNANGQFAIAGTGAERVDSLNLSGAGIAHASARVVNRKGFDPRAINEATR